MCIGNNFAFMEAALMMCTVTQRYWLELRPDRGTKAQPKTTLALLPGMWVTAHAV
jgi:cytochrome P450